MKIVKSKPMGWIQFLWGFIWPNSTAGNANLRSHCWKCRRRIQVGEVKCPCGVKTRW